MKDRDDCRELITRVGTRAPSSKLTKRKFSHSVKKLVRRFDSMIVNCEHMHTEA